MFPYGSVPLKIYLLDGDIDLTVLCSSNVEEALASDVHAVLKGERQNENAEFEVKNVQFNIIVEVKPVKCLVKDIVIDISFNQLGGLSTLCFLKQVDRLIGNPYFPYLYMLPTPFKPIEHILILPHGILLLCHTLTYP